jgi:hypothetical protein
MSVETHSFMDGKVQIYKRENSRYWQCSTYMDGRNHRTSTKEESLTLAKEFAKEWYMTAYVNVENVLNRRYNEVVGYPALKANFRAGMRFRIGGE